jgi:hypothetical protein
MQLVTEGEVLQLQNGPTAKSADKNLDDRTHALEHAAHGMAVYLKTPAFSARSEFSAATGEMPALICTRSGISSAQYYLIGQAQALRDAFTDTNRIGRFWSANCFRL